MLGQALISTDQQEMDGRLQHPGRTTFYLNPDEFRFAHLQQLRNDLALRARELNLIEGKEIAIDYHCDPSDSRYPRDKGQSKSPDKMAMSCTPIVPNCCGTPAPTPSSTSPIARTVPGRHRRSTGSWKITSFRSSTRKPSRRSMPTRSTPQSGSWYTCRRALTWMSPCA